MLQVTVSRRHLMVLMGVVAVVVLVAWVVMSDRVSAATSQFDDVPDGNVFVSDINWLADAGVTRGCNPPSNTKYCPSDNVTREQMAAFMHRLSGGDSRTIDGRLDALEAGGGGSSGDLAALEAAVAALTTRLDTLESENAALKATLSGVTRDGDTLMFTGMNLQVVNGTGATWGILNGLGNVIIGYNEPLSSPPPEYRLGSHYLIVGDQHAYTSYAGVVAGRRNTASGPYALIGGYSNTASGNYVSVTGGVYNTGIGNNASVTGGQNNTAVGNCASVVGGDDVYLTSGSVTCRTAGEGFWNATD